MTCCFHTLVQMAADIGGLNKDHDQDFIRVSAYALISSVEEEALAWVRAISQAMLEQDTVTVTQLRDRIARCVCIYLCVCICIARALFWLVSAICHATLKVGLPQQPVVCAYSMLSELRGKHLLSMPILPHYQSSCPQSCRLKYCGSVTILNELLQ